MIIIVEPQCHGYEHSDVNAALLAVINGAWPTEGITFYAETNHLNLVKNNFYLRELDLIEYKVIDIPTEGLSDARRIPIEWKLVRSIFKSARSLNSKRIIFASITSPGLWCIKILLRFYNDLEVIVIPHSILETITIRPVSKRPWIFLLWFRFSLLFLNISRLKYLLYGESKKVEICRILPKIQNHVISINLPYFFNNYEINEVSANMKIKFGSFGDWHIRKGTDLFFQSAADVHKKTGTEQSDFILIGHISNPEIRKRLTNDIFVPSIDKPLEREEFEKYANLIDYAVFCFNENSYRLTVSGSFHDALSHVKPIIAINTPFFEYYFDLMGDIGYLCRDYEDMIKLMIDLVNNRSLDRYNQQRSNILKGRKLLDLRNLSVNMKKIIGT